MYCKGGVRGTANEWTVFQSTPIYRHPERYFQMNDRGVLMWDRALSPYSFGERLLTPYKR